MYNDDRLDESEYPDERDMDDFGDDSPVDYDPMTVGYLGDGRPAFWTPRRIIIAVVVALMVGALVVPLILGVVG